MGHPVSFRDSRLISGAVDLATLGSDVKHVGGCSPRQAAAVRITPERRLSHHDQEPQNRCIDGLRGRFDRASVVYAQSPTALEQAELAGLSPEMRAQVQARAVGGNSVTEVLQVMLLNNIKIKHPASQIVAMDWGKGVAVVQLAAGGLQAVLFDPSTLQIKG